MTIVGISDDPVEDSARLAAQLDLDFALLADRAGEVARQYVGTDDHGNALPGVVLIDADGTIAFRQIGERKDDRLGAQALLDVIDRTFGPAAGGAEPLGDGYLPVSRLQLRSGFGGGAVAGDGVRSTGVVGAAVLVPVGRHLLLGPTIHAEARGAIDLDGSVRLRLPVVERLGWVEVGGALGTTVGDGRGWNAGASLGVQFAIDPRWAVHVELTGTGRADEGHGPQLAVTVGVARLLRLR